MRHSLPTEGRAFLNRPYNDNAITGGRVTRQGNARRCCASFPAGLIFSTMAAAIAILLLLAIYAEFVSPSSLGLLGQDPSVPHAEIKTKLITCGIIPDIIDNAPKHVMEICYGNANDVGFGEEMKLKKIGPPPHTLIWPSFEDKFYTLIMIDPDFPSRMNPSEREFLHWLIVNIPDDNFLAGIEKAEYWSPEPELDSGPHRYVFMVFDQPRGKINCTEPFQDVYHDEHRKKFNTRKFTEKYGLGSTPLSINFFIAENLPNGTATLKKSSPNKLLLAMPYLSL